jgi:FYVE, RhoGEF and PH domain containing 5/6
VDHWVPAIWIPDGKTSSCMRCGRSFGWRRRRHHCRLCGRCICASCSGRVSPIIIPFLLDLISVSSPLIIFLLQTFFISDSNAKQQDSSSSSSSTKPARACDACYDTVFPVIHPPPTRGEAATNIDNESRKSDTIPSLSHLPSWLSMPSLPVARQPHALMAIDTTCSSRDIISSFDDDNNNIDDVVGSETEERERKGRIRIKSHQRERVRSYQQLLEDFQQEQSHAIRPVLLSSKESQSQMMNRKAVGMGDDTFENGEDKDEDAEGTGGGDVGEEEQDHPFYTPAQTIVSSPVSSSRRKQPRRENTARRSKRFSLPALGLQTTVVTARTSIESEEAVAVAPVTTTGREGGSEEGVGVVLGEGGNTELLKRYSLVLAGRNSHQVDGAGSKVQQHEHGGQTKGLAATRLSELLATKI